MWRLIPQIGTGRKYEIVTLTVVGSLTLNAACDLGSWNTFTATEPKTKHASNQNQTQEKPASDNKK